MLAPTVEFIEYFARANSSVYLYSFNHHKDTAVRLVHIADLFSDYFCLDVRNVFKVFFIFLEFVINRKRRTFFFLSLSIALLVISHSHEL